MNPESENFEQLRKLLALKRHELPPPGYFNSFSGQVIARIKAGEQERQGAAWLKKLLSVLEHRPLITGAFGAGLCALAIAGIVFTQDAQENSPVAGNFNPALNAPAAPIAMNETPAQSPFSNSTNPVSPELRSLLSNFPMQGQTMPAAFSVQGNPAQ
jgi:hypothetical protein